MSTRDSWRVMRSMSRWLKSAGWIRFAALNGILTSSADCGGSSRSWSSRLKLQARQPISRVCRRDAAKLAMVCADMVALCRKDAAQKPRKAVALLEDIAPSGACLQMEGPLPLGVQFAGYVRYCVCCAIGYFVGGEFAGGSRWPKEPIIPSICWTCRSWPRKRASRSPACPALMTLNSQLFFGQTTPWSFLLTGPRPL